MAAGAGAAIKTRSLDFLYSCFLEASGVVLILLKLLSFTLCFTVCLCVTKRT